MVQCTKKLKNDAIKITEYCNAKIDNFEEIRKMDDLKLIESEIDTIIGRLQPMNIEEVYNAYRKIDYKHPYSGTFYSCFTGLRILQYRLETLYDKKSLLEGYKVRSCIHLFPTKHYSDENITYCIK